MYIQGMYAHICMLAHCILQKVLPFYVFEGNVIHEYKSKYACSKSPVIIMLAHTALFSAKVARHISDAYINCVGTHTHTHSYNLLYTHDDQKCSGKRHYAQFTF